MKFLVPYLFIFLVLPALNGCGVKGDPLPPEGDTPEESDRIQNGARKKKPEPKPTSSSASERY